MASVRLCLLIAWLGLLASHANAEVTIRGQLQLSDIWQRTIYVSSINSLAELFVCSDHLIVSSAPIDTNGHFELTMQPVEKVRIIRLHVSKKGAPAATLIIGGSEENHGFFGIEDGKIYSFQRPDTTDLIFNHFDFPDPLNVHLRKIDQVVHEWQLKDRSIQQTEERMLARAELLTTLKLYSDTCSLWLPRLYALYRSDMGFNQGELRSQMATLAGEAPSHSYFKPYARPAARPLWILPISLCVLMLIGYWTWHKFAAQKLAKKVALLSPQELKVAGLVRAGKTNKEIAYLLHVEISTVKSHVYRIFHKLEISSRQDIRKFFINQ